MLIAALAIAMQSQPGGVWEKLIAPGVTYRMEVAAGPTLVHAVRVTPEAEGVLMAGELGTGRVFDDQPTKGRETVTDIALRTSALVTVNADFFPFTGDPLGAMVRDGELISSPQNGRAAFCWGKDYSLAGYLSFSAQFGFEGQVVQIYGVNQECGENMVVLNTPVARYATSREPATHAVLVLADKVTPAGEWRPKVKRIVTGSTAVPINDDEIVLTFRGSPAEKLTFLSPGDEILLRTDCKGADWAKSAHAIAGGPFLVKDSKPYIPYPAEGFTDGFAKNRHPRTALGKTKSGDIWIVAVDGRQAMSVGATLEELAALMLRLGCTDAINLDGGGSTTLNIWSLTVNRPSEGVERPVANALLVFSSLVSRPALPVSEAQPVIAGPAQLRVGEAGAYRMVDATGSDLPQADVLWSAQGAAWIDQGGVLHGSSEGECRVVAFSGGQTASLSVAISKGPKSPTFRN